MLLLKESRLLEYEDEIQEMVQKQMDDSQREYYLREQLKVISSQLNNGVSPEEEIQEFRDKIAALPVDDASKEKLLRECDRLERYAVQSPEAAVSRNYLETCLNSHGANIQKITSTLPAPTRYLRRITTGSKRSRSAYSNSWRCARSRPMSAAR